MRPYKTYSTGVQSLSYILNAMTSGRLLVPTLRDAEYWAPWNRASLLNSIAAGVPIGSIVTIVTRTRLLRATALHGVPLPEPVDDSRYEYVVDGAHRLAAIYEAALKKPNAWRWLYREDARLPYLLETSDAGAMPSPCIFDTIELLEWLREHPEWIEKAETLSATFYAADVPFVRLVDHGDAVERAERVFSSLHRSMRRFEAE